MTRRNALPTVEDVQHIIEELTETTGNPPTVLALAGRLGLANTTFRRHFPDIAAGLQRQRATTGLTSAAAAVSRFDQLKHDNDKLRRDNHELAEHLELAVANIQRLTLENHQLRQQLQAAAKSPGSIADVRRGDHSRRVRPCSGPEPAARGWVILVL